MIFKCWECGHVFEDGEERHIKEDYGEEHNCCPVCCGAFREANACKICGTYENIGEKDDFCKDCKKEVKQRFQKLLSENFTKTEIELLNDLYEGECF